MNNEQREFLVTKVGKYNKQIDKLNDCMVGNTWIAGMAIAMVLRDVVGALTHSIEDEKLLGSVLRAVSILVSSGSLAISTRRIMDTVAQKAGLSNRVREIEDQLGLDELDSKKGMGK